MIQIIQSLRSWFHLLFQKITILWAKTTQRDPKTSVDNGQPEIRPGMDRFRLVSWIVTLLVVAGIITSAFIWKSSQSRTSVNIPIPTAGPEDNPTAVVLQNPGASFGGMSSIFRQLKLKTDIPERPRYESVTYRVSRGDAMLAIAEKFNVKTATILYVNKDVLDDNPHSLRPGMELLIPPVDGLYHEWEDGDTLDTVAEEFDAEPDEILNFPGNQIDLTDPVIKTGTMVMIPGGSRALRDWTQDLQTAARSNTGSTGTSDFGTNACGGGPVASGFGWPADDHAISGNGYGPGHLGIDISAPEGASVYAAGDGVVTMAQGGYNYGYGNVVQIDHGAGYVTVYAHLSQINVGVCTPVGRGTLIGLSGSTGNAFGAHLHFEIRVAGSNINPLDIVQ
jgi:murein DD-endopeptidase MepM/ murein hydrolase activator NlpD